MEPFGYSRVFAEPLWLHLAFYRDVGPDLDFVLHDFARRVGRPATSLAEVQAGPAYYAQAAARRGLSATAFDTRQDMLDLARSLAPDLPVDYRLADPRALPGGRFDLVLLPLDSAAYLVTDHELLSFWRGAHRLLARDGVVWLEANHPKDVGHIDYGEIYGGRDPRFPDQRVVAEWGVNNPRFALDTHRVETQIRLTVSNGDETDTHLVASSEKLWFPRELSLLSARAPLQIVGTFGGWADRPLDWTSPVQVIAFSPRSPQ